MLSMESTSSSIKSMRPCGLSMYFPICHLSQGQYVAQFIKIYNLVELAISYRNDLWTGYNSQMIN